MQEQVQGPKKVVMHDVSIPLSSGLPIQACNDKESLHRYDDAPNSQGMQRHGDGLPRDAIPRGEREAVHYGPEQGKKHRKNSLQMVHFPTSSGVSE